MWKYTTDNPITYKMSDQDVLWNFKDLKTLHGTNLPIFGGDTYPCISVRLRSMSKPIRVLSGIDYWLDNLMSHVPEVTMCYHSNSFVQKNELMVDEDLPDLDDSTCSSKVIIRVAQNILSFLKLNITKPGHTYWLFSGKNDDIVKLYDLSSICSELLVEERSEDQNSFTVPVAMLFYRVARNLQYHPIDEIPSNPATIKILLNNCLKLLNKIKHPQIVTSIYYMLSDFYIPFNTDPVLPTFKDFTNTAESSLMLHVVSSEKLSICSDTEESIFSIDTHDLCPSLKKEKILKKKFKNPSSKIIVMTLEERCQKSLYHVCYGLSSLHYLKDINQLFTKKENVKLIIDESNVAALPVTTPHLATKKGRKMKRNENVANKNNKNKNRKHNKGNVVVKNNDESKNIFSTLLCKSVAEIMPTWYNPPSSQDNLWKQRLNTLFYEKACLAYVILAENDFKYYKYGRALKYYRYLFKCWMCIINTNLNELIGYLLERSGDCCISIAQNWDKAEHYTFELETVDKCDLKIRESLLAKFDECKQEDLKLIPINIKSKENMLKAAANCYQRSIEFVTNENKKKQLNKRIGNVYGEMTSEYIEELANATHDSDEINYSRLNWLLKNSENCLSIAIDKFESINDQVNLTLLYSHMGQLYRYVSLNMRLHKGFKKDKDYAKMAVESYTKALAVLGHRRFNENVWDLIFYDLSTTIYNMAVKCHENPSQYSDRAEAEKEALSLLLKALKYCDLENDVSKKLIYEYRAADIHDRLGSVYHFRLRFLKVNMPKFKIALSQGLSHYKQSYKIFFKIKQPLECLDILIKNIALDDFQIDNTPCSHSKMKFIMSITQTLEDCACILEMLFENKLDDGEENCKIDYDDLRDLDNKKNDLYDRENKKRCLLGILEDRLKEFLLSMIKLSITKLPKLANKTEQLKKIYAELLRTSKTNGKYLHLLKVVTQIKELNL